MEELRLLSCAS